MNLPEELIEKALAWANQQEETVLKNGRGLSDREIDLAKRVDLSLPEPDSIRLMGVPTIPSPDDPLLMKVADELDFDFRRMDGMAFNRGIYVTQRRETDRCLIVHELTHVVQWDRLGKREFLEQYLPEIIEHGHGQGILEKEAKKYAAECRKIHP